MQLEITATALRQRGVSLRNSENWTFLPLHAIENIICMVVVVAAVVVLLFVSDMKTLEGPASRVLQA